ncbi:hypothetical protein LA080_015956 [Diaporthe eres]|nr:hypothetical protein LA080_015956 [Diaporthe eres]
MIGKESKRSQSTPSEPVKPWSETMHENFDGRADPEPYNLSQWLLNAGEIVQLSPQSIGCSAEERAATNTAAYAPGGLEHDRNAQFSVSSPHSDRRGDNWNEWEFDLRHDH